MMVKKSLAAQSVLSTTQYCNKNLKLLEGYALLIIKTHFLHFEMHFKLSGLSKKWMVIKDIIVLAVSV